LACTAFAPVTSVLLAARTAQPVSVPSSQLAVTVTAVAANWSFSVTSGALAAPVVLIRRPAWHGPVPSHAAAPLPVLALRQPSCPMVTFAVPSTWPVQPASGHRTVEPASPVAA
jgi:hypothetical protein